jgi:amino acid transporter
MESLMAFLVTFTAAVPVFIAAAVFLAAVRRRMRKLRREDIEPGEKRLRGIIGAAASLAPAPILPPALYLAARGSEAAEVALIVSAVFIIPLSYFVVAALVSSVLTVLSAAGKGEKKE